MMSVASMRHVASLAAGRSCWEGTVSIFLVYGYCFEELFLKVCVAILARNLCLFC